MSVTKRLLMNMIKLRAVHLSRHAAAFMFDVMSSNGQAFGDRLLPFASRKISSISLLNGLYAFHRSHDIRIPQPKKHRKYGAHYVDSSKLFGSKSSSLIDGEIYIENQQYSLPNINIDRIRTTIARIRRKIGYNTYDVSLLLVNDSDMKQTNYETRGINQPTDILSFPFHEAITAGEIQQPQFDIPEYYQLGDMMIDVPYVIRRCLEDQAEYKLQQIKMSEHHNQNRVTNRVDGDTDEDEREGGVSGAMSIVFDPEDRVNMLLIHGMLHLVGYDHESDDDYYNMIAAEEELLQELFPNNSIP